MPWTEVFIVLVLSHLVGDFALQTDWQAQNKKGGLGGAAPAARRALLTHIATYTVAFVPALVWLADEIGAWAIVAGLAIAIPHLIQDDGRILDRYIRTVKGPSASNAPLVSVAVDQTFHLLALFAVALVTAS